MHLHKSLRRIVMLTAMLLVICCCAAAAEVGMISEKNARIYADASLSGKNTTVKQYTLVNVLENKNGVSKISANGYTVYIDSDMLTVFDEDDAQKMEFSKTASVFQYPSTSSRSAKVKKGTVVNVVAIINNTAIIEKDGVMAFTYMSNLTAASEIIYDRYDVVVTADKLKVYTSASTSADVMTTLTKGAVVTLVARNDEWAIIEKNGVQGCCKVSGITRYTPPVETKPEDAVVYADYEVIVTADSLTVYGGASTSAKVITTLKKGDIVNIVAYNSEWAIIEKNGIKGCCKVSGIKKYVEPKETTADIFANDKYSNEQKIYYFIVNELGYSPAAACGVLANIKCESTFRPTAYNPNGGSYGICQWTGGRYTNLQNWCAENGYDYTSLEGQCWFLKYELENRYTKVHSFMKGVENTDIGAYDAGYYYCYNFEVPANRGSVSIKRGNMAKDDYWPKYIEK